MEGSLAVAQRHLIDEAVGIGIAVFAFAAFDIEGFDCDNGSEFLNSEADLLHRYIESLRDWAARGGEGPKPQPTSEEIVFYV